jgi:hypothetical protein
MCNLLIPLCPFVLHSLTTSGSSNAQNATQTPARDAQILFSYLSKRPYEGPTTQTSNVDTQPRPLALKTTKLYKRTNWHTCPCFFDRVSILHPLPGPSKPTFGSAYEYCGRCSKAAKLLRPMRLGGINDASTRNDPYWNRCIFTGLRGVFGEPVKVRNDRDNGTRAVFEARPAFVPPQTQTDRQWRERSFVCKDEYPRETDANGQTRSEDTKVDQVSDDWRWSPQTKNAPGEVSRSQSGRQTYQSDLDSYIAETYGSRKDGRKDTR